MRDLSPHAGITLGENEEEARNGPRLHTLYPLLLVIECMLPSWLLRCPIRLLFPVIVRHTAYAQSASPLTWFELTAQLIAVVIAVVLLFLLIWVNATFY